MYRFITQELRNNATNTQLDESTYIFIWPIDNISDIEYPSSRPATRVWKGILSIRKNCESWIMVKWDCNEIQNEVSMRRRPLCFKSGENVYIDDRGKSRGVNNEMYVPDLSCKRFYISDGKTYTRNYVLPYPVPDNYSVMTDLKESMSIIMAPNPWFPYCRMLIFTEKKGFQDFNNADPLRYKAHISTLIRLK